MLVKRIGIDLGTANVLVFVPKKGIIINEPSVVAISNDQKILAVGEEAKLMVGKTPHSITAYRPLRDGVIADYVVTEAMIRYFINKVSGGVRLFRPEIMVSVPAGVTSTEKRAVIDATKQAGAKEAYIIPEPVAAAIGAGIPIDSPAGNMIIDIGGGTTEVAIISLGGIVASNSVRVGGNKIDQSIADYIRKKYGLAIGDRTAEEIKIEIGSAIHEKKNQEMEIRGRDMIAGLPKTVSVSSHEITEAMRDELDKIILAVRVVLEQTPPELASDVIDRGMVMTGGGSLLRNIGKLLTQATGIPCIVADDAKLCVAKGTGIALEHLEDYKRSFLSK
ncbi:TPA: rod shape-determining protein [candidate division CPR2 bacterium]|uniref:Cell shape-determining protein MreB n=1 Tax=candidate division CPR2 bacterium GW2011_GWC1_41_48 TaxID=1618344 RepID=A0A0G0W9X0_UNCC2|nr:MAG: Cell shape determining protein, MreB/Mrl family [candidate division CPR2 bacterium GW2011_GWC2_39_35]KKR27467.1 MAG: Cell shape determining protein, MreB/Mrl family [candidate division CPR2 bacterium GW2011_GWD2_39_7]KKS09760.1 MAG: cell shape determining protein, MreB/Mrl family, rod shape-determining protein MreB [candidate division CPR2 bacterium GW2011_GWC1_41_48]OGB71209.1 MAG: rod shape-determining protein [candidate division CPR2 bacterium GWD2_39_7]HBG81557.1 rod shape-determini